MAQNGRGAHTDPKEMMEGIEVALTLTVCSLCVQSLGMKNQSHYGKSPHIWLEKSWFLVKKMAMTGVCLCYGRISF